MQVHSTGNPPEVLENGIVLPLHKVSYYLRGRHLATHTVQAVRTNNSLPGYTPSRVYGCPVCGEVWGREEIVASEGWPRPEYLMVTRTCQLHGGGHFYPNLDTLCTWAGELPLPLLTHEFLTHTENLP